jgi:PEP-CTERM motif.
MNSRTIFLASLILSVLGVLPLSAAVVYSEDFLHTDSNNILTSNGAIGWNGYVTSTGAAPANPDSGDRVAVSVNNGPDGTKGYLYSSNSSTANLNLVTFDEFASSVEAGQITWKMGNNTVNNIQVRLLIKQGTSWYATTTTYQANMAYSNVAAFQALTGPNQTFNFTTAASAWQSITLTPGAAMPLGSTLTSDLASNQIDGIGFYISHTTATGSTMRIDDLVVNSVPEPASMLLGALGALGMLAVRRRG